MLSSVLWPRPSMGADQPMRFARPRRQPSECTVCMGSPRPHRRPDWAHPAHIGARTGLNAHIGTGTGPTPHLRPDWADSRRRISCRGGLRSAANLHVFWSEPLAHLRADEKRSAGWVKLQCERNHACAFWLSASAMRRTIRCVGTFRSRRAFPNCRAVPCRAVLTAIQSRPKLAAARSGRPQPLLRVMVAAVRAWPGI